MVATVLFTFVMGRAAGITEVKAQGEQGGEGELGLLVFVPRRCVGVGYSVSGREMKGTGMGFGVRLRAYISWIPMRLMGDR